MMINRKKEKYVDPKGYYRNGLYIKPKKHKRNYSIKDFILPTLATISLLGLRKVTLKKRIRSKLANTTLKPSNLPLAIKQELPTVKSNITESNIQTDTKNPIKPSRKKRVITSENIESIIQNTRYGKITKLSAGNYITRSKNGGVLSITKITEGSYRNYWIVRNDNKINESSDPVPTYKQAIQVAKNWEE